METIVIRGIPVETLLQAYDARERTRERNRANRQENDRQYRQAHAEERKAYNKAYYERKKAALLAVEGYVPPKRGRKPKTLATQADVPQAK
jgi:hypothetical protein